MDKIIFATGNAGKMKEVREILKDLMLCDNPYNCAHGRPTIIHYSNYELERMFKRVMN